MFGGALYADDRHNEVRHLCREACAVAREGWVVVRWHAHGTCSRLLEMWWDCSFQHVGF